MCVVCELRCARPRFVWMGCIKVMFFLFLGPKCWSDHLSQFVSVCKVCSMPEEESIPELDVEKKRNTTSGDALEKRSTVTVGRKEGNP